MPKISNRPLIRLPPIRIWQDTYDYLSLLYKDSEIGFAGAVREILDEYVSAAKHRADEQIDQKIPREIPTPDPTPPYDIQNDY